MGVDDLGDPAGWQLAFGPSGVVEVEMAGWHGQATLRQLCEQIGATPAGAAIRLVSGPFHELVAAERDHLAEETGRELALAPAHPSRPHRG